MIVQAEPDEVAEAVAVRDIADLGITAGWVYLPEYDIFSTYNVEEEAAS